MFDRDSAAKLSSWLQDLFFMMAVSNSCMNPLVYGSYAMNLRKECWRCCFNKNSSQINLARKYFNEYIYYKKPFKRTRKCTLIK